MGFKHQPIASPSLIRSVPVTRSDDDTQTVTTAAREDSLPSGFEVSEQDASKRSALRRYVTEKVDALDSDHLSRIQSAFPNTVPTNSNLAASLSLALLDGIDYGRRFEQPADLEPRSARQMSELNNVEKVFKLAKDCRMMLPKCDGERTDIARILPVWTPEAIQARDRLLSHYNGPRHAGPLTREVEHDSATCMSKIAPNTPTVQAYRECLRTSSSTRGHTSEQGERRTRNHRQRIGSRDGNGVQMTVSSIFDHLRKMTSQAVCPTMVSPTVVPVQSLMSANAETFVECHRGAFQYL